MSHDRNCGVCGAGAGDIHTDWCRTHTAAEPREIARQGHDESPAGVRATMAMRAPALAPEDVHPVSECNDLCIHGKPPTPPHPVHGRPEYGGFDNLQCAGELSAVYDRWAKQAEKTATRPLQTAAHEHAVRMALMKISRIATGHFKYDHYDDAKVYLELAKQERRSREREKK